ncbi:DUF485 domain-containing protein [Virgibacillus siamensis]|uniref:DUF485 domain-containing protein n=1 Tax=Virgibacillus siamensis TaxID=480071 RepID=UPI001FE4CF92|nr:DUF485 domain-containing protein [Virgibacillus siamensis]
MKNETDYNDVVPSESIDYEKVEQSEKFQNLMQNRRKFIVPMTIFFLVFYFLLPILTSYTTFLNTPVIGDISWVWLFAIGQFVMTWVLCTIYVKKAAVFDKQADEIIDEQLKRKGRAS